MGDKMCKWIRVILALVMLFCLGMFAVHQVQVRKSKDIYEQAEELASMSAAETMEEVTAAVEETTAEPETVPVETEPPVWQEAPIDDDPYIDELAKKDLKALQDVNPDVMGWIVIPGTQLDYPLMDGEDNDYYLKHTWDNQESAAGAICLEMMNDPDLMDFNTLIYGHRMKNESMFGSLKHYDSKEYFEEHPYVYVLDNSNVHRYEIFSAYTAPVDGMTFTYGFRTVEGMQKFLDFCMEKSVIDTEVVPTVDDKILTLVTCTGRGYEARWVVQARLKGVAGNPVRLYSAQE